MSKGQKIMLCTQYRYIQCYAERVERLCYVHNIDKFNAMSKGLKDYVMLPNIDTFNDMSKELKEIH